MSRLPENEPGINLLRKFVALLFRIHSVATFGQGEDSGQNIVGLIDWWFLLLTISL